MGDCELGNKVENRLEKVRIIDKFANKRANKQIKLKCHVSQARVTRVTRTYLVAISTKLRSAI